MSTVIKKLSPELIPDYIEFFDKVAFTDNEEWAGCYCLWYHLKDEQETGEESSAACEGSCDRRSLAARYIREGRLQGYLAYEDGVVAGWCNSNDKSSYVKLSPDQWPELWDAESSGDRIKSVVCYTIAPHMRRNGIATKLLEQVILDARAEGYTYVEAYPGIRSTNVQLNYHGPLPLYEKFGFTQHRNIGDYIIVRKYF